MEELYFLTNSNDKLLSVISGYKIKTISIKKYLLTLFDKKKYTILVGASARKKTLMRLMDFFDRKNRIILWYWDSVASNHAFEPVKFKRVENWTFDKNDSEKYKMHYNSQVWFDEIDIPYAETKTGVFYFGGEKGRIQKISDMKTRLDKLGICNDFALVGNSSSYNVKNIRFENEYISYYEYLNRVSKWNCIFESMVEGQSGITLRTLEALFLKKKLITDNSEIVRYSDIYNKNNFFVIGIDNFDYLNDFVNGECDEIDEEILEYYKYENWVKRFFE